MKSETLWGMAVGAGAMLAAPVALPVVRAIGRPLVKAVIKQGLLAYERARVALAERAESLEDVVAEARAEAEEEMAKEGSRARHGDGGAGRPVAASSRRPS